jgi:hypothetical protein
LSLRLSDGRQLLLFGHAKGTVFLDVAADRQTESQIPPAVWRNLTQRGPFRIDATTLNQTRVGRAPRPGDRAFFSLDLYTSAKLKQGAGSGTLSCSYVDGQDAFCDGTLSLTDGSRVTASGYLDPSAPSLSLDANTDSSSAT